MARLKYILTATRMKYLLCLFCVFCSNAFADLNIDTKNVHENFSETVKVSGKFHMGIQFAGQHDFDNLYVDIPKGQTGLLCIRLASINGLYKAQLEHPITAKISGRTKINFTSKYENRISSLKENELSVLATLGTNCETKDAQILMASWSKSTINNAPILIIRSGARIDIAHIPSIEHSKYTFKCEKYKDTDSITFDKYCKLAGIPFDSYQSIEVFRKNFRELPSKKIVLAK